MDQEAIKKALDFFEEDKFSDAKEIMQKEIRTARDEYLENELGIDLTTEGFKKGKKVKVTNKSDDDFGKSGKIVTIGKNDSYVIEFPDGQRGSFSQDELSEDSTADAKGTLDAIIGSTKKDGGDIYDMAVGMKKSYDKNKGFSKDQAKWIYNTSQMMFKK